MRATSARRLLQRRRQRAVLPLSWRRAAPPPAPPSSACGGRYRSTWRWGCRRCAAAGGALQGEGTLPGQMHAWGAAVPSGLCAASSKQVKPQAVACREHTASTPTYTSQPPVLFSTTGLHFYRPDGAVLRPGPRRHALLLHGPGAAQRVHRLVPVRCAEFLVVQGVGLQGVAGAAGGSIVGWAGAAQQAAA